MRRGGEETQAKPARTHTQPARLASCGRPHCAKAAWDVRRRPPVGPASGATAPEAGRRAGRGTHFVTPWGAGAGLRVQKGGPAPTPCRSKPGPPAGPQLAGNVHGRGNRSGQGPPIPPSLLSGTAVALPKGIQNVLWKGRQLANPKPALRATQMVDDSQTGSVIPAANRTNAGCINADAPSRASTMRACAESLEGPRRRKGCRA